MDAEGEEASEIAIKRMTKQKKKKRKTNKKKKGEDRRRGDPVVINGTRSMRKHYVIDGESSASVRAPFSNLRCLFNPIQPIFLRGARHGLLKIAFEKERSRCSVSRMRLQDAEFRERGIWVNGENLLRAAYLDNRKIVPSESRQFHLAPILNRSDPSFFETSKNPSNQPVSSCFSEWSSRKGIIELISDRDESIVIAVSSARYEMNKLNSGS